MNNVVQEERVQDVEAIRNLALTKIEQLQSIKHDLKLIREEKKSIMDNDSTLQKAEEAAESYLQAIKEAKSKIKQQEDFKSVVGKEKEVKDEMKDIQDSLSHHLISYSHLTGVNAIEDHNGKEYKIKHKCSVALGQQKMF